MSSRAEFWILEDRRRELSAQGDSLEQLQTVVAFHLSRLVLSRVIVEGQVTASHKTSLTLGGRVLCPDLRQKASCMQARQTPGIDLVCLDPGMGDRLYL